MSEGRLPTFLIIGSAKAGTTTLFADLAAHEQIYFPVVKEPCDLLHDKVLTDAGLAQYRRLFRSARADQILGEASTPYTARPMYEGVAERALRVLGRDLKLIYVVRDPLDRVISEQRYMARLGKMPPDINVALRDVPRIVERSRYAFQIEPWLQRFGRESLKLLVFEQYVANREATVRALFEFLGARPPADYRLPDAKNSTDDVIVPRGILRRIVRTEAYRRTVRSIVPAFVRDRAKRVLGRRLDVSFEARLTPQNERQLLDRLRPEVEALHQIAGWDRPVWPRFA
jgi:hypothetical protein